MLEKYNLKKEQLAMNKTKAEDGRRRRLWPILLLCELKLSCSISVVFAQIEAKESKEEGGATQAAAATDDNKAEAAEQQDCVELARKMNAQQKEEVSKYIDHSFNRRDVVNSGSHTSPARAEEVMTIRNLFRDEKATQQHLLQGYDKSPQRGTVGTVELPDLKEWAISFPKTNSVSQRKERKHSITDAEAGLEKDFDVMANDDEKEAVALILDLNETIDNSTKIMSNRSRPVDAAKLRKLMRPYLSIDMETSYFTYKREVTG